MGFCKWCSESKHPAKTLAGCEPVNYPEILGCDCGCHQVMLLEGYDKEAWWLPAKDPNMGLALVVREKPRPGIILTNFYREPSPLGALGPWIESCDGVEIDLKQLHDLKEIDAVKEV